MKEALKELGPLHSPASKQSPQATTKKATNHQTKVESPTVEDRQRMQQRQLVTDLLQQDRSEVGKYILNLLEDIRGLREQNRKLKKQNQLNSLVENSYKSDLNETLREHTEKIRRLEERNRELEAKLNGRTVKPD